MLERLRSLLSRKKQQEQKRELDELIEEIEEGVEQMSDSGLDVEGDEGEKEKVGRSEPVKAKGRDRRLSIPKPILIGALVFVLLGVVVVMMESEGEEYYGEYPVHSEVPAPFPPSGMDSQGADSTPLTPPAEPGGAGFPPSPASPPPPPPTADVAQQGGTFAMAPSAQQPPPPSAPLAMPADMPSAPPGAGMVESSPVVKEVQKKAVDNPFVIKKVDKLVREAIHRVLEEERAKIKKEMEALRAGEKASKLPSKGAIKIGLEDEETEKVVEKESEEFEVPVYSNAIVVSSIIEKGGERVLISNVGVIKKGLVIDGWAVKEVRSNSVVLEKEYYALEGTKKVKRKKVEVVPFIFDFSMKPSFGG